MRSRRAWALGLAGEGWARAGDSGSFPGQLCAQDRVSGGLRGGGARAGTGGAGLRARAEGAWPWGQRLAVRGLGVRAGTIYDSFLDFRETETLHSAHSRAA